MHRAVSINQGEIREVFPEKGAFDKGAQMVTGEL
jgi:hypothetical protein